tara:strand:- start:506 stop:1843 length:1338 start_codon:yes stop_codon:yes gene_type:complete
MELEKLRKKINEVDDGILKLLALRAKVVSKIGKQKKSKVNVVDLDREQNIIERLVNKANKNYSKDTIIRIWREIFQASSKLQIDKKSIIETKRSIDNIKIYKGGKSFIAGKKKILKLSSNESSLGASPNIQKINYKNISQRFHRYPEVNGKTLRKEIAKLHKINSEQIVLGCGSDEVLLFAALSFCKDGDEIIQAQHGFEMYPIFANIVGAVTKYAKEDKNYKISVESICEQITDSTKLIFIANPNNPTGNYLSKDEIIRLMKSIPKNIIVVLDGAYTEYVTNKDFDNSFSLLKKFNNIIFTRTFSKSYGLAGLRIGWCYSSPSIVDILNKVKGPFNTGLVSQEIAISALKDQKHINQIVKSNIEVKKWFEKELKKLNIVSKPSVANFSFIETTKKHAKKIASHLLSDGIVIRQLDSYNLPHCLRITIGTKKEMELVIKSLKKLL